MAPEPGSQKVRAWGPGLEGGVVGKSADFVVEAIGTEVGTLGELGHRGTHGGGARVGMWAQDGWHRGGDVGMEQVASGWRCGDMLSGIMVGMWACSGWYHGEDVAMGMGGIVVGMWAWDRWHCSWAMGTG